MRRAYIAADQPFDRVLTRALAWAGDTATIHAPNTAAIEEDGLCDLGIPVTSPSRRSQFYGHPRGTVIAAFLTLHEVLDVERQGRAPGARPAGIDGLIVLGAHGPHRYAAYGQHHSAWIKAFDVEHLAGEPAPTVAPAPAPLRAAVHELTNSAVRNQGLSDKNRERSEAVHALTYLRNVGVPLDPDALMVEALRNQWGGEGPETLRQIAIDLNKGTKLQYNKHRLTAERLHRWAATAD